MLEPGGSRTLEGTMTRHAMTRARAMPPILCAWAALASLCFAVTPARGDQMTLAGDLPVVSIKSSGGTVTINGGDPGVRVHPTTQNVSFNRFIVNGASPAIRIPQATRRTRTFAGWQTLRLPPRRWTIPAQLQGRQGFAIGNPGGDMNVFVPRRVGALFVNAGASNVVLNDVRGPYVIQTAGGTVRLHNVAGRGFIRTLSGDIDLTGVGGNVRVETATGNVVAFPSAADRAEIVTGRGDITWVFGRMGRGVYRFQSNGGLIKVSMSPQMGAFVDAQSDTGTVSNFFDPSAALVRFVTPHAVSLSVAGGGPEITLYSKTGGVIIGPIQAR